MTSLILLQHFLDVSPSCAIWHSASSYISLTSIDLLHPRYSYCGCSNSPAHSDCNHSQIHSCNAPESPLWSGEPLSISLSASLYRLHWFLLVTHGQYNLASHHHHSLLVHSWDVTYWLWMVLLVLVLFTCLTTFFLRVDGELQLCLCLSYPWKKISRLDVFGPLWTWPSPILH